MRNRYVMKVRYPRRAVPRAVVPEAPLGYQACPWCSVSDRHANWNSYLDVTTAVQSRADGIVAAKGMLHTITAVGKWVAENITYRTDDEVHGTGDYWQSPDETLARGTGDCEDHAFLTAALLRAAGLFSLVGMGYVKNDRSACHGYCICQDAKGCNYIVDAVGLVWDNSRGHYRALQFKWDESGKTTLPADVASAIGFECYDDEWYIYTDRCYHRFDGPCSFCGTV